LVVPEVLAGRVLLAVCDGAAMRPGGGVLAATHPGPAAARLAISHAFMIA
jgi:hypothetical protein